MSIQALIRAWVGAVLDHRSLGYIYDTENPTAQDDHMHPGDTLRSGDSISSGDGRYRLVYETDGNLVLLPGRRTYSAVVVP